MSCRKVVLTISIDVGGRSVVVWAAFFLLAHILRSHSLSVKPMEIHPLRISTRFIYFLPNFAHFEASCSVRGYCFGIISYPLTVRVAGLGGSSWSRRERRAARPADGAAAFPRPRPRPRAPRDPRHPRPPYALRGGGV